MSRLGIKPAPWPHTLCKKGNFSPYLGKNNLGNFSLYMALHPIPSPHLENIIPKSFISADLYRWGDWENFNVDFTQER